MTSMRRAVLTALFLLPLWLAALAVPLIAQEAPPDNAQPTQPPSPSIPADQCRPALEAIWAAASAVCIGRPQGFICNGGTAPNVEPAGPVANALAATGALIDASEVDSLRTPRVAAELGSAGVVWVRPAAPLTYTALLFGDVFVRDVSPPDFPAWTSIVVTTAEAQPTCLASPLSALVLQTPVGLPTRLVVNGASLALAGTVLVHTDAPTATTTFVALSGESSVLTFGVDQPLLTGQQLTVQHDPNDFSRTIAPPTAAIPFDTTMLQNLPVGLFDRPLVLPQPGNVVTQGDVNLRSAASTDAGVIVQVPGGEILSVLGRSPDGAWYHVRRETGDTGWMLAELLARNVGEISAVYEATPLPPQRYGQQTSATGRVIAPAGVNMRTGPDAAFGVVAPLFDGTVVTLLARSPYGPWVKVDSAGTVGWLALVTLETQAFIEALPVDPGAPPPPAPTRIPGSFGNAFPDPNEPPISPGG